MRRLLLSTCAVLVSTLGLRVGTLTSTRRMQSASLYPWSSLLCVCVRCESRVMHRGKSCFRLDSVVRCDLAIVPKFVWLRFRPTNGRCEAGGSGQHTRPAALLTRRLRPLADPFSLSSLFCCRYDLVLLVTCGTWQLVAQVEPSTPCSSALDHLDDIASSSKECRAEDGALQVRRRHSGARFRRSAWSWSRAQVCVSVCRCV